MVTTGVRNDGVATEQEHLPSSLPSLWVLYTVHELLTEQLQCVDYETLSKHNGQGHLCPTSVR